MNKSYFEALNAGLHDYIISMASHDAAPAVHRDQMLTILMQIVAAQQAASQHKRECANAELVALVVRGRKIIEVKK